MGASVQKDTQDPCRQYFVTFLPALTGKVLVPGLRSLSCALGVVVTDMDDECWTLSIIAGRLEHVSAGGVEAESTFLLDRATLLAVVTGGLAPDEAFFDMRIEIEGDVALGLQLSTVLEPFFQQYPFPLNS